jgi:Peptidase family M1 domain
MRLRHFALTALVFVAATAASRAEVTGTIDPPLSPRNASYVIDARLDPASRTITGSEVILWRNITAKPATELQLHLYWNAWRDDRSTWLREAKLGSRRVVPVVRPDERSRIDVTALAVRGSARADLTTVMRFIAPDDGNADDRTVLAARLPQPVAPGGSITIEVSWTAHVPRTFARTGVIGNYFFVAQWFPKLGVLQDTGWNCHQFHSGTEFFADYGSYDVRMTVPTGWILGATGVERERRDNGNETTTHRYRQDDVHDFVWTTSPDYIERRARFEHPTLPAVDMRLLIQPEHARQADRHFEATRAALKYYGEWYGAYPYGHITIIDPAYRSGAGGMEYPTLFTAGTRLFAPEHVEDPEDVAVHEAGHQFWYGIVGNNEFEDAWMDEGFNTFSEARVMGTWGAPAYLSQRYFGGFVPYVFKDIVMNRETDWNRFTGYRRAAKNDVQSTPSFRYYAASSGVPTYNKTALWLNTMERWLGWPTLQQIMSTHFSRWKFKHPKPQDFFDIANEVSGRDLSGYFDQVYRSSDAFDYGIQDFRSDKDGDKYRTLVVVRRYGEAIFPVDVRVTFTDGKQVTEHWDGKDRWHLYTYSWAQRAVTAQADPDRVLLLDVNLTNNSKALAPLDRFGPKAATKWSLKWMVWLQDCLLTWSVFA